MKSLTKAISLLALGGTFFPSVAFLAGWIQLEVVGWLALLSTLLWFVATPLWMGRREHEIDEESPTI